jgi:type II secretion system (T2SS) protein M
MTLSERDRRAVLLLGVAVAGLLIYRVWTRGAASGAVSAREDSVQVAERRLQRLREIAATAPAREQLSKQIAQDFAVREKTLIAAGSAELAQEKLLEIVRRLAKSPASGLDIRSQELGRPKAYADFGEVTVTLSMSCRIDQLVNFLSDLTTQPESLGTEELHISGINADTKMMQVRLVIGALVPAKLLPNKKGLAEL